MAPVVAMSDGEDIQDLKRSRRTPPPAAETAVASPLPAVHKAQAHVNKNINSFDKLEEWRSNLRCVSRRRAPRDGAVSCPSGRRHVGHFGGCGGVCLAAAVRFCGGMFDCGSTPGL